MSLQMQEVLGRVADLPSLSAVVVELMSSMEQEDLDIKVLGDKIALDQSLAAKTLRLSNSSFYGMQAKVTTIDHAIAVLGFHSIRTLVTACSVTDSFAPTAAGGFDFKAFWRHSVASAVCAKLLAPRLRLNPEAAFTAGLLHDIGSLVLATRFPAEYEIMLAEQRARDCQLIEAERAVFGIDHAMVGAALAAHWKFPPAIQDVVANHHRVECGQAPTLTLAVYTANTLAHALDLAQLADELAPPMPQAVWDILALSAADSAQLFGETETTFHELAQILVN